MTTIELFEPGEHDDQIPRTPAAKRRAQITRAYKQGGMDILEEFVPGILDAIARQQELLPKVYDLVESFIETKDMESLKALTPMVKLLVDENKRLLDRRFGTSVQRAQVEGTVTVQHVSLRDLMAARSRPEVIEG